MKHSKRSKLGYGYSCFFLACLFLTGSIPCSSSANVLVDTIVFSYNRPMQLYALLESMYKHMTVGRGQTYVLCRIDNDAYAAAYKIVQEEFPDVHFIRQGNRPKHDFKPLLLEIFSRTMTDYIMFAVDDIIVKDTVDLCEAVAALAVTPQAYGFYLRLGSNIKNSYASQLPGAVPRLHTITDTVVAWIIQSASADWKYPHTVDMTIYRKGTIASYLKELPYSGPNTFEGHWSSAALPSKYPLGLCYITSKIVNIPYNRVQDVFPNLYMHEKTTDELLYLFISGKKIAIDDLWHINNSSPHMEYSLRFVDR